MYHTHYKFSPQAATSHHGLNVFWSFWYLCQLLLIKKWLKTNKKQKQNIPAATTKSPSMKWLPETYQLYLVPEISYLSPVCYSTFWEANFKWQFVGTCGKMKFFCYCFCYAHMLDISSSDFYSPNFHVLNSLSVYTLILPFPVDVVLTLSHDHVEVWQNTIISLSL